MKLEQQPLAAFALFSRNSQPVRTFFRCLTLVSAITVLASCGNEAEVETNPVDKDQTGNNNSGTPPHIGPTPTTTDLLNFRSEFWDKLAPNNRCGSCHTKGGQAASYAFVELSNIFTAYANANSNNANGQLIVNRDNPAASRVVVKVAEGHQCWDGLPNTACANIIEGYINNWVSGSSSTGGRGISLSPPSKIVAPGDSRNFPPTADENNDPNSFENTVYPVLTTNCAGCHSDTSATPQSPFFASADVFAAYAAAKSKIDLDNPANSRFVTRILELHNCWTSSCSDDATAMQDAISTFANAITPTQIDAQLVTSKAMTFADATLASGGNRYENDQIALWEFKTGVGNEAFDTSGIEPAMKLTFTGSVNWILGYGLDFSNGGKAQASTVTSKKLNDLIRLNGAYSIEAWVIPGNVTQEDARIISYSAGDAARNFSLSQTLYNYEFLNRTDKTNIEGRDSLISNDEKEFLQSALQHVVVTFDPVNGRRIYVNGVFTEDTDAEDVIGGSLLDWNDTYAFVLGNEVSGKDNAWSGKLRMVAIHNRALTQEQIIQNMSVGVGQKYFMLFSVSELLGLNDAYVLFKVEQYDNTAYLFEQPTFISLDENFTPTSAIALEGLRIGVNGREAVSGQVFGNLTTQINTDNYTVDGQKLSRMGTVIAVEKGPESDEFFLSFEVMGNNTNPRVEAIPSAPTPPADAQAVSDIGIKTFDEINNSMSVITGVPVATPAVATTFATYKQQLPSVENIQAFLSSHQMGVAQLAMSYCNELVQSDKVLAANATDRFFKGFDFSQTAQNAFTPTAKNQIIEPLLIGIMNLDVDYTPVSDPQEVLNTQPGETELKDLLASPNTQDLDAALTGDSYESLVTIMTQCGSACDTSKRTEDIVIGICAATLGSAMTVIQ